MSDEAPRRDKAAGGTPGGTAESADLRSASRISVDRAPAQVIPGLWSIPVDIPIDALKIVNVYAFEHSDRSVTLLDTGWDTESSYRSLIRGLAAIGRRPTDVAGVVVTHAHPDHLGLAHRFRDLTGAPIVMERHEAERISTPPGLPRRFRTAVIERFPQWGVPHDRISDLVESTAPSSDSSWSVSAHPVDDGDVLDVPGWSLRAVWTPGHTPGHLCLHDAPNGLLFTGDHVLPRITPGVGTHPADTGDALGDFLASLNAVGRLPVNQVLPGHEHRFHDLGGRVRELRDHHDRRLDEIHETVANHPRSTAWSVANRITWSRPLHQFGGPMVRGAVSETIAHLNHLATVGLLRSSLENREGGPVEVWSAC